MSIIEGKNYHDKTGPPDIPLADEYRDCNFSQVDCIDDDGDKKGVRLFPGDDTPRTFTRCNMKNCEPPPLSTCVKCNQAIIEKQVLIDTDTVTIDGHAQEISNYAKRTHGFIENGEYNYFTTPKDKPINQGDD